MKLATATATQPQMNGNGIHTSEMPLSLVDERGEALKSHGRDGFMARLDEKGSKEVTLKQSTLWFVGTAMVAAGLLLSYGTSAIGWIREDEAGRVDRQVLRKDVESVRSEIKETRDEVKDLNRKFDELQKVIQGEAVQRARREGFQLQQGSK